MIKESVLWKDKTILNENAPNNKISKYVREELIDLKGAKVKSTIRAGGFNITFK